jgi:hypothetical protein
MMDAIQVYPELMQVAGDLVVKAQDWPGADKIAERLQQVMAAQQNQIDPKVVSQMQQELQKLAQENQELKSDKLIEAKKLEIDAYNAKTQRIRALSDNEVDGNAMEQNAIQTILEHSQELADRDLAYEQMDRNHEVATAKASQPKPKKDAK